MATTTPNFGWDIPQSTDLVKDGATAIAALGNDIDTSMVDLKGGTTGQILSKASNTDLDFTWINNDPGDITGVTAGTGITGGGTSGDVSVAFDVANYGGGQYAAGKNKIINGDFGIWQRGTSFSSITNRTYTADRWCAEADTAISVSRQAFTPGSAPVAGYESQYFMRMVKPSGGTFANTQQLIEDVRTFAGQTIVLSFWAKADAAISVTPYAFQNFGVSGSTPVGTTFPSVSLTTSWNRYSVSITLPSISGKTIDVNSFLQIYVARVTTSAATTIDTWGVQLEAGSTATPFTTATGTIQGELAACQRYYYRQTATADSYMNMSSAGIGNSTTSAHIAIQTPVQLRVYPSSIDYSTLRITDTVNGYAITAVSVAFAGGSANNPLIAFTVASGLTQYRPYYVGANNSTSAYLGLNAEL